MIYTGKINGPAYITTIQDALPMFIENAFDTVNDNWIYMQDNTPPHTSKYLIKWFKDNNCSILKWPANSPDRNAIDSMHKKIKKIKSNKHRTIINDDSRFVAWCSTIQCQKFVNSMPRRVKQCILARDKIFKTRYLVKIGTNLRFVITSLRNDDDDDDHDDELPESMEQTLEMPGNTFSTPAPYRRRKTVVRRSSSPDSILSVSSPKRFVSNTRTIYSTKYVNNDLPYLQSQSQAVEDHTVMSSSDDEEIMAANNSVSFGRLFEEIKSTKANIRYVRTENHGIHQQLTSLTKKLSRFSSLVLSKNENDLDRYRDSNVKESYKSEIMHDGCDLLEIPARNPREYARNLLKLLFKPLELQTCLLPSQQSKRYSKSELDQERFNRLNDAIRTRYRITKHHYTTFYKERIQETLVGCLYNEGTRKTKKQPIQQQQLHKENEIVHGNTSEVEDEIN
ncbi:unnamed protein product [Rotaria magnacalcarata]|nr:unnamed protein product [Rotaria magnacalcarata]